MRRAVVIAVALAGLLVGTASAGAESGDLRIGSTQDFESPNPLKSVAAITVETQATIIDDQLIGLQPGQKNVLVRVVLRHAERTLTREAANELRDRVYAALHDGESM